jgi:hypothetical protein
MLKLRRLPLSRSRVACFAPFAWRYPESSAMLDCVPGEFFAALQTAPLTLWLPKNHNCLT